MSDHSSPSKPAQANIPEGLRNQLEQFKKQLWRIKIAEAVLAGFFGLLFSFLLVFGLDRFIETPPMTRLIILILGVSIFAIFAPYWIRRWVYGHRRENQLAKLISRRYPKLGDRLLGAVELQDQKEGKDSLSPALRAAAMRTVAADAAGRDLTGALPVARHKKLSFIVMGLFIFMVASLVIVPEAGVNSLKRWLLPLSKTERFTFTQLDLSNIGIPHHVAYGEAFTLTIPLDEKTSRRPETARARYGNDGWVEAPLLNGAYAFQFPGQRASDSIYIEADDAQYNIAVEPSIRPSIENIRGTVNYPSYLQRLNAHPDLRSGFISLLVGSEITIEATASRALSAATSSTIQVPKEIISAPGLQPEKTVTQTTPVEIHLKNRKMTSGTIAIGPNSLIIPITWTDIYGLDSDKPFKIRIQSTQDQIPSTYIQGIERQQTLLAEETLSFEILAEDDYGLKACGITWQGESTELNGVTPAQGELTLEKGGPTRTSINHSFSFSPANLSITPQKLLIRSWTEDYKPGRGRIYSEPITLFILTKTEHAQMLKSQFDKVINELEDIARKEQNNNDENQRLNRKNGKELQNEENRKKLLAQQDAEMENKDRMKELTKNMEELFKKSVRNGEINKETLKKMSRSLQSMRELADQDLPKVEQKLEDAQSQRNTEEKTKKDLQEAIEEQKKALDKMKQTLKEANEANQQLEASTFVNRIKRAASEQEGIASSFINIIDLVIGANFNELDPVEQRAIKATSTQLRQTAADIKWIQEDLSHYYTRTQEEKHQKLIQEMADSRIDEAMEILYPRVASNISYGSIDQSKKWAAQLREWAKQLDGENDGGGGGGGGGGGQQQDTDFEFMLKVMRMIQKEQDIRGRTRALENLKRSVTPAAPAENNVMPEPKPRPRPRPKLLPLPSTSTADSPAPNTLSLS